MSAMLCACGTREPAADAATEPAADTAADPAADTAAEAEPTEAATEAAVTADELGNGQTNTLAVKGPTFTGMTNIVKENNDDE